jgi:hypothetical protein
MKHDGIIVNWVGFLEFLLRIIFTIIKFITYCVHYFCAPITLGDMFLVRLLG